MKNNLGLYIHIPFCRHICNYCDFFKRVSSKIYQEQYVDYLIKDILKNVQITVDTIYIGGGTPSSLDLNNLNKLLKNIEGKIRLDKLKEYTIELNPEDINLELIQCLKQYSINRISIGVQTFNARLQKILGRVLNYEELYQKIALLKKYGYQNINVDLMYGIADETLDELREDVTKILTLQPAHISTYSLILEEKTILYHKYLKGEYILSDEDLESEMYYEIIKILEQNDFHHYEISNFALPNHESIHNLIYWSNGEYLGIGAGSSGYINGLRYKVTTKLNDYFLGIDNNTIAYEECERIDIDTMMWEEVMLGLRKIKGVSIPFFLEKYNVSLFDVFSNIKNLITDGFLEIEDNFLKIPKKYYYISNAILTKICR